MKFEAKRSIVVEKPVDKVWSVLWDGTSSCFGDGAAKILSNVKACNKVITDGGDVKMDGICGRELTMMDGSTFTEMLVKVDKENHILSYSISGLPFGIVPVGTWIVSKVDGDGDDAKSTLELVDNAELSHWPPRFLAYPVLALMVPGVFDAMLADVKHYAETGEPSPAKLEAQKKLSEAKN